MEIFIIGDRPSKKNKRQDIPFVGTRSYKKLLEWIYRLDIDISNVKTTNMFNSDGTLSEDIERTIRWVLSNYTLANKTKVIMLGSNVLKGVGKISKKYHNWLADKQMGMDKFFLLPHPSPRNRVLNDKKYEREILEKCKKWLNG